MVYDFVYQVPIGYGTDSFYIKNILVTTNNLKESVRQFKKGEISKIIPIGQEFPIKKHSF